MTKNIDVASNPTHDCQIPVLKSGGGGMSLLFSMYVINIISMLKLKTIYFWQDSLYYLDADGSEEKPAIVVKQLVLALPENRLATLLSQQKFEEAEAFAKKFDLDPEVCVCTCAN